MRPQIKFKLTTLCSCLFLLLCFQPFPARTSGQTADQQLARQAFAIIQARCLKCHGVDQMSGLDLRTREGAFKGGSRGAALFAGRSDASLMIRFVSGEMDQRMPPDGPLAEEQITLLKKWIDEGAVWPDNTATSATTENSPPAKAFKKDKEITDAERNYWAFKKPARHPLPTPKNSAWVRTPVDAFVLAALERKGLAPSPPADKRTLLRRVTFDLTGLPPTPEEIASFLADNSPDAYEKVVKRLLSSPRYGERWAQHWLDIVRFGETNGYELDAERPQAWRYRDYVVKAFNEDKPYDRFIIEQLAGDELEPDSFESHVATGFLRAGPQHVVAGNQDEALNRQEWLTEAMLSTSSAFLGLTVGCARCHDHKFDPILQSDFYRLQAFFAATDNSDFTNYTTSEDEAYQSAMKAHNARLKPITDQLAGIEKPYNDRITEEKRRALEPQYLAALAVPKDKRTPEQKTLAQYAERMLEVKYEELLAVMPPEVRERRAALRRQMHALALEEPAPLPRALAVADKLNPIPAMQVLKGGDVHSPVREVQPRFLTVMLPKDAPPAAEIAPVQAGEGAKIKSTGRRFALARWLASPDHPLTARVMMNRLWQHHFGRGIVATPNDFGRHGSQPTHPELLDWLATEFIARGWSVKAMHELMVLSNTYQQSSANDSSRAGVDPDNTLLWRLNRQRLDAEALRDSILAVTGTLTEQFGGPPIRVPMEPEVVETIFTEYEPDNLWPVTPDVKQHTRRSLYLFRKRNVKLPMLVAFDTPDLMSSCGARSASVHALQSLTMMNSDFMQQQSRALAKRLFNEAGGGERRMITRLYELTLGRPPQPPEMSATQTFLKEHTAIIRQRIASGEPVAQLKDLPKAVDAATAAAWVDLCLATLNLNEFLYVK
ncbi:MAG TPA: PSD1 and planctomycete cytochrome C domain-containing protein [Blastocatellia bacterium]|nr:PSD1 and planctomycete cytochrome C domain-containing protein [Blastocatellia bacterium]